jgi:hypothetical protein
VERSQDQGEGPGRARSPTATSRGAVPRQG